MYRSYSLSRLSKLLILLFLSFSIETRAGEIGPGTYLSALEEIKAETKVDSSLSVFSVRMWLMDGNPRFPQHSAITIHCGMSAVP